MKGIAEFGFVTSDYPLILSIENHCKRHANLIQRMATLFTIHFGERLVSSPFPDYPVSSPRLCGLAHSLLLESVGV